MLCSSVSAGRLGCGGLFHAARRWQHRKMVASSPSADSLLIPGPLNPNVPREREQCSCSDAQLNCAAVFPLKLLQPCTSHCTTSTQRSCRGAHRVWSAVSFCHPTSFPPLECFQALNECLCSADPPRVAMANRLPCACSKAHAPGVIQKICDISAQKQPRTGPSPDAQWWGPAWPVVSASRGRLGLVLALIYGDEVWFTQEEKSLNQEKR